MTAQLQVSVAPETCEPLNPVGFDDRGELTAVVQPVYPHDEPQHTEPDSVADDTRIETIRALLAFLALGETNLKKIGWRTAIFCHLVFPNQSQAALAKTLGVSNAAVSEKLKAAREELASFLRATSSQPEKNPKIIPLVR